MDEVNDKGIVFFEDEMSVDFALNMNERVKLRMSWCSLVGDRGQKSVRVSDH